MTLVVGRKLKGLTYLIADTASSVTMTSEKISPIANPICKIVVHKDVAVAYAGNTYFLPDIVRMRDEAGDFDAFCSELVKVHRRSDFHIDFLLLSIPSRSLSRISSGRLESLEASHIGSRDAFENFQKERSVVEPSVPNSTFMNMIYLPECSVDERNLYAADLNAFNRVLQNGREDVGGFAVPFFVDAEKHIFGIYVASYRRPIDAREFPMNSPQTIDWEGAEEGAFTVNFSGCGEAFACHVRQANLGLEFSGSEFGIEPRRYHESEGEFAKRMDDGRGIKLIRTTGQAPRNQLRKHPLNSIIIALTLRREGRLEDAIAEISACIEGILASCTDSEGRKLELSSPSVAAVFAKYAEVKIPIEYVGYLMQSVRLRYEFMVAAGTKAGLEQALSDHNIMRTGERGMATWSKQPPEK